MPIDRKNYIYVYPLALLTCWIAAWLFHTDLTFLSSNTATDTGYWICAKIVIWLAPVFLLIGLVEKKGWRQFLELTTPLKGLLCGLVIGLLLVAVFYGVDRVFLRHSQPKFLVLNLAVLNGVIVAPLVEEIVFRGFYLRKLLLGDMAFWAANGITTVFFVCMHLPGWYFQGRLNLNAVVGLLASLALFSLVLGLVKVKSRSLYAPIVIHVLNNLYSLAD